MSTVHNEELEDTHITTIEVKQNPDQGGEEPYPIAGLDLDVYWHIHSDHVLIESAITSRDDANGSVTVEIPANHNSSSHKKAEYRLRAKDCDGRVETLAIWTVARK